MFGRQGVLYVGGVSVLVLVAGGGGLALIEPQTVHGGGFLDGIWWAIVTASTVGYGDIAPTTLWGRAIAILVMLTGVGLISTLAGSITAYFVGQQDNRELTEIKEQLARLEAAIQQIRASE